MSKSILLAEGLTDDTADRLALALNRDAATYCVAVERMVDWPYHSRLIVVGEVDTDQQLYLDGWINGYLRAMGGER